METSVNNKCRAFTSLEQSKKLAKILPLESADMFYRNNGIDVKLMWEHNAPKVENPCWSLAALLDVLPKYELNNFGDTIQLDVNLEALATEGDETLLDLVVNMIIHLHELKML